jgi:hypothetical protein
VRGTIRESNSVERPPHPDPLPASGAREKWSIISARHELNYHFNSTPTVPWCDCIAARNLAS